MVRGSFIIVFGVEREPVTFFQVDTAKRLRGCRHFTLMYVLKLVLISCIISIVGAHTESLGRSAHLRSWLLSPGFVGPLTSCAVLQVRCRSYRSWTGHDRSSLTWTKHRCCFHFRPKHDDPYNHEQNPFMRLFCASLSDESTTHPHFSQSLPCDESSCTESRDKTSIRHPCEWGSEDHVTFNTPAFYGTSWTLSPIPNRMHETHDNHIRGKRAHYNDALLKRILNGRSSSSERWRRRTRRAAAALGINFTTSVCTNSLLSPFSSWSFIGRGEATQTNLGILSQNKNKRSAGTSSHLKLVPPITSALKSSARIDHDAMSEARSNHTHFSKEHPISSMSSKKDKTKSSSLLYIRPRNTPLTREEYDKAKKEWTDRYTNLSNLRSTFGTNRNKLWGDFDPETTRRLYKTLLPRALLGLYEMGLWSPTDLAPLAYEARLAAKKYARERCVVPGRLMSMVYDGFRSWRDWGTWNVEGMSWEQVWYKYETQIMGELCKTSGAHCDNLSVMQEEITALVCLRILERSCITNEAIDRLILRENSTNATLASDEMDNNKYNLRNRKRKAERDIARIAAQLERDMEELLKTPVVSTSTMMKWRELVSHNVTTYSVKDREHRDDKHSM